MNAPATPVDRKARALFHLRRHLKGLEAATRTPAQEAIAAAGLSYEERQTMGDRAAQAHDTHKAEIQAFRDAIATIEGAELVEAAE